MTAPLPGFDPAFVTETLVALARTPTDVPLALAKPRSVPAAPLTVARPSHASPSRHSPRAEAWGRSRPRRVITLIVPASPPEP